MALRDTQSDSTAVVRLEFELTDQSIPFVGLSAVGDCELLLEEILPWKDGGYRGIYYVSDCDPERLLRQAASYEDADAHFVERDETSGLLELCTPAACPAAFLAEQRAFPRRMSAVAGTGQVTAQLPPGSDEQEVTDAFLGAYPDAKLVSKCQQSRFTPIFNHSELEEELRTRLTDRQRESLLVAYEAGFYEWPREVTGEDLAAEMDITPATFTQHIRAAERKVLDAVVE